MAFVIQEASFDDIEEYAKIHIACHVNDDIWKPLMANVTPEDFLSWVVNIQKARFYAPERKTYKVVETATGKLVAYATLHSPWKGEPTAADKFTVESPPGINEALMKEFFGTLSKTIECGYDSEKHFHRQGTMVLPEFQKKGLGTMLSLYCNEIADKAGAATYVAGRPNSLHMLQKTGFRVLEEMKLDMTKYGGNPEDGRAWALVREPEHAE